MSVFRSDFSLSKYFILLNTFRQFYRAYEKQLLEAARTLPATLKIDLRLKARLLDADLLGHKFLEKSESPVIPSMNFNSETIGVMYVMEGSTLGGQIISRHLQKSLDLGVEHTHFFRGYNESTGQMWLSFKREAEQLVLPESFNVAVASAKNMFFCFGDWLERSER